MATKIEHDDGYYCPFKWLTSASWSADAELNNRDAREFKAALARHFPRLAELQARAKWATGYLGGTKPVGPDLWLVAGERHLFIEVKLPKDSLAPRQLAGLALLATSLPSDWPIEVMSISLDRTEEQFSEYVRAFTA